MHAFDIGYRHIDTAQVYHNEAGVGRALRMTTVPREDLFITTKVWLTNFIYPKCYESVLESLRKLQVEYIDLVLIHRPNTKLDHKNVLDALLQLQKEQKIHHIGVSNYPIALLQEAIDHTGGKIYTNQVEHHIQLRQKKLKAFHDSNNIITTAYYPLAHGRLTDNPKLHEIGKKYNKTASQIAIRRLIEQDNVSTIVKSVHPERIQENFAIFDFALDASDYKLIDTIPKNKRYCNPDFHPIWDK